MASVEEHYDNLLARHYTWMRGDFDSRVHEYRDLFERIGVSPRHGGKALDLGAGSGFQSVALAGLGFEVLSLDLNGLLLEELRGRARGRPIRTVRGDIRDPRIYEGDSPFEVAVCMGDTLTHLGSTGEVAGLISAVGGALQAGGTLILEFRDLATELKSMDRAIPVRLDENKIMLTFLEYGPERVNAHDIVFVRDVSGWNVEKSAYTKIRLGPEEVMALLDRDEFRTVERHDERGFSIIAARK